jgi:hypothetical protein
MAIPTPSDVALLALDLGKATFDNTYDSVTTLQDRIERGAHDLARDSPWLPRELRGVLNEWIGFSRRTRKDLKDTVDRCYVLLRALADGADEDAEARTVARGRRSSRHLRVA